MIHVKSLAPNDFDRSQPFYFKIFRLRGKEVLAKTLNTELIPVSTCVRACMCVYTVQDGLPTPSPTPYAKHVVSIACFSLYATSFSPRDELI